MQGKFFENVFTNLIPKGNRKITVKEDMRYGVSGLMTEGTVGVRDITYL